MAAKRPIAVATSASAMPGATTASDAFVRVESGEGVHHAPDRAEKPDVRGDGADRGEHREPGLKTVHLALVDRPHRPLDAVKEMRRVEALPLQLRVLAHAGREDLLLRTALLAAHLRPLEKGSKLRTAPEALFEVFGRALGAADLKPFLENQGPADHGERDQDGKHDLHDERGVKDERNDGHVSRGCHLGKPFLYAKVPGGSFLTEPLEKNPLKYRRSFPGEETKETIGYL